MFKAASIQFGISDADSKEKRITHAEELIDRAADADLILLPELWNVGFFNYDKYRSESETLHGETISRMAEKAKKVNSYLLAGSFVQRVEEDDSLRNTAVLLTPKGDIAATYDKVYPGWITGDVGERTFIKPGRGPVVVKTDLGILGLSICYDIRFAELFRTMALNMGVEVFLYVSAWPIQKLDNWMALTKTRANENLCWLISCGCTGVNRGATYLGASSIIDPNGLAVAHGGWEESIVRGQVDISEVYRVRKTVLPSALGDYIPVSEYKISILG